MVRTTFRLRAALCLCAFISTVVLVHRLLREDSWSHSELLLGHLIGVSVYSYPDGRVKVKEAVYKHPDLSSLSSNALSQYIQFIVNRVDIECSTTMRFGQKNERGWDLCLVGPFRPKKPCKVLSFGIGSDFSFDDEIAKELSCSVYAFDPTMNKGPHRRGERVVFDRLGIHGHKHNLEGVWPVDTLSSIKRAHKLDTGVVDMMKMDSDWSDYATLKTALEDGSLKNVKQFVFELHLPRKASMLSRQAAMDVLFIRDGLYNAGFRVWKYSWNDYCNRKVQVWDFRTYCYELYFLNVNFLDFENKLSI